MNLQRGSVVCSRAGHDKGSFFFFFCMHDGFAFVADGKGRTAEKPKKKNVLHLACTATILSDEILNDDSKIRQALKAFNSRRTQGGNLIV